MVDTGSPLIPFRQIPSVYRKIARVHKSPSFSAVRRWYRQGVRGGVKLDVCYRSGEVFTTTAAIKAFIEQRDAAAKQRHRRYVSPSPSVVYNAQASMARLEAMGV